MEMDLRSNYRYAIACPTSMGVRITPDDRMAVHNSNHFYMQTTSAESNVLNVSASLGKECLVLTKFVKGSPIAQFIKNDLRSRNIRYEGAEVEQGSGVILSTSSMVSISGQPSGIAYPTSKFAVNGFTISLARELGPKGIRVNAVAPGITETDMMKSVPKNLIDPLIAKVPLRRLGQPEDIANAFLFLASDDASYISGVILSVDGMSRT